MQGEARMALEAPRQRAAVGGHRLGQGFEQMIGGPGHIVRDPMRPDARRGPDVGDDGGAISEALQSAHDLAVPLGIGRGIAPTEGVPLRRRRIQAREPHAAPSILQVGVERRMNIGRPDRDGRLVMG
jgi:hypothetical protein